MLPTHHASSQKYLLSLFPRAAARACPCPWQGVPVTAAPASPGSLPATCKHGHPGTHSHRSLLALAAPSQPAGRPEGLSLPMLPPFLGLGQTHACVHPDHGEGVWCGLSLSPAHSTEQAGAGPGEFHLCPAAQLTSHSKALDQQCLGKAVPIKY